MLEIRYIVAGQDDQVKSYASSKEFIAGQLLEVPALQDYYKISQVTLDGKEIDLSDKTIGGLFNYFNQ